MEKDTEAHSAVFEQLPLGPELDGDAPTPQGVESRYSGGESFKSWGSSHSDTSFKEGDSDDDGKDTALEMKPLERDDDDGLKFSGTDTKSLQLQDDGGSFLAEVWYQVKMACPMVGSFVLQLMVYLVSLAFVGHTGKMELAAASLASSLAGSLGIATMEGLAGAVETFCGQAFGAGRFADMGIYLQRGMLALGGLTLPLAGLWINLESVLKGLGQDPQLAHMAGVYMRCLMPGLLMQALLQPTTRFLQSQEITLPLTAASIAVLAVHIPLNYVLIFPLGLGYTGAALATSIAVALNVALLAAYIRFSGKCDKTWTGWDLPQACRELPAFVRLAASSTVMTCLEYWIFDTLIVCSGWLPRPELQISLLAILTNLSTLSYQVPLGLAAAVSTRVSNELGAGRPLAAQKAARASVVLMGTQGVLQACVLLTCRDVVGRAFTNDPEVAAGISRLMGVHAVLNFLDCSQGCMAGIIRGCGRQDEGAAINLVACYLVGLPMALALGFLGHLEAMGLWLGLAVGSGLQNIGFVSIIFSSKWQEMAEKAAERVGSEGLEMGAHAQTKDVDLGDV